MTVALSLNNSNSIQLKNKWSKEMSFPKTPVQKSSKQLVTKKEGKILYISPLSDTKRELFNDTISPTITYKIQEGDIKLDEVEIKETIKEINSDYNNKIKNTNKFLFFIPIISSLLYLLHFISVVELLTAVILSISYSFAFKHFFTKKHKEVLEQWD